MRKNLEKFLRKCQQMMHRELLQKLLWEFLFKFIRKFFRQFHNVFEKKFIMYSGFPPENSSRALLVVATKALSKNSSTDAADIFPKNL